MWLSDPFFMRRIPGRRIQAVVLCVLLWVALPLLTALPGGVLALFGVLWLMRMVWLMVQIKPLSGWALLVPLILVGVVVFTQQGTIIGRNGGVAFLLLLVMLKAYESRGLRDWQILLLAMLMLMGAALLFNQSIWTAPWLCVSLYLLTLSMGLISGVDTRIAWQQSLLALALAVPMAAVLFVAVPRRSEPLWGIPQPQQQAATGLSDTLHPGSISKLIQSNKLAFNATFDNNFQPQKSDLYWRAIIMAQHNGTEWRALDERYIDADNLSLPAQAPHISYQLILTDDHGRIPALDYPLPNEENNLSRRMGDVVRVNRSREGLRRIRLQAVLSPYLYQPLNEAERALYTDLPTGINPRTRDLARHWQNEAYNTRDYVQRVLAYFRQQHFRYTLSPRRSQDHSSTDFFLFDSREGFCEDYADAFVWLARAAGIPARIITGYQGGEYHTQGQFWQIRSKDAHAWAEVWLPEKNAWWRVDPTAAISTTRIDSGVTQALPVSEQAAFTSHYPWLDTSLQNSQFYWQQWIVNYDAGRQQNLLSRLGLSHWRYIAWSLLTILGVLLALLPMAGWWQRMQRKQQQPLSEGIIRLKNAVLDENETQRAALGADELQHLLARQHLLSPALQTLLEEYLTFIYTNAAPPSHKTQRAWLRRMKRAIRQLTK